MTYIIVGKARENQNLTLQEALKRLFGKDLKNSPDVHILNPEEENSIGIEEVKIFQKEMMFKPFEEKFQAGIILEAEKLTHQAQNALLKTLEDTSAYSVFFLCVDNEKNLLPTIISRSQIIYSSEVVLEEDETEEEYLDDILDLDLKEQFEIIEKYSQDRNLSLEFVNSVEKIFHKRLELDIKNGNIDESKKNSAFLNIVQESREKISANCNRRLTLEAMIIQLRA